MAGRLFGDRIVATYNFYEGLFAELHRTGPHDAAAMSRLRTSMEKAALPFEQTVKQHFPHFHEEISAMAKATKLPLWQLYVLNARTEIYRMLVPRPPEKSTGECTALFFPQGKILGQNWDWHPKLEELSIVVKISRKGGKSFVMLTEPGIVGKIGVNSDGLGVCLNILFAPCEFKGVPIHVLLRGVLESASISAAEKLVQNSPRGTVSNMLIADASGDAVDLELLGEEIRRVSLPGGELLHTNHYFADEKGASAAVPGSVYRLARARDLYREFSAQGVSGMQKVLSDREHPQFPICRAYAPGVDFLGGTVAGIVMDLPSRTLLVSKGQPSADKSNWTPFQLS